jgi:putative transposase
MVDRFATNDLWSHRIVGWAIDERMKARLVVAAIEMALARRGGDVAGCIFHTDRGSQGRARKVHRTLARQGLVGSMGKVGSAGVTAAMKSSLVGPGADALVTIGLGQPVLQA